MSKNPTALARFGGEAVKYGFDGRDWYQTSMAMLHGAYFNRADARRVQWSGMEAEGRRCAESHQVRSGFTEADGHGRQCSQTEIEREEPELPDGAATALPVAANPQHPTFHRIRLLIANYVSVVSDALALTLSNEPGIQVVGATAEGDDILDAIDTSQPHVILIDCTRDEEVWPESITRIAEADSTVKVLALVLEAKPELLTRYVRAGAVGCVTSHQRLEALVDAIKRVSTGEIVFPAAMLLTMVLQGAQPPRTPTPATGLLGPREREVLEKLAIGLSTEEAAISMGISVHTVRTHLRNILTKLRARSKLHAVVIALRASLIEMPS